MPANKDTDSDMEETVTKSNQQADAVGDNQLKARGRSLQRDSLTNTDQREKVVNLKESYAYENLQSAVAGSDSGGNPSRPESSGWRWEYIPAYRLSMFSLEEYLRKKFGNYKFFTQFVAGDKIKFWVPRALAEAEEEEILSNQWETRDYGYE